MSDDNEMVPGPLGMPIPRSLLEEMRQTHDRAHMDAEGKKLSLFNLLDRLGVDDLRTLRIILNQNRAGINYIDGMVANQLRLVHHLDPDTGESLLPPVEAESASKVE